MNAYDIYARFFFTKPEAGAFATTVKLTVTLWARMIEVADVVTVVVVLPFKTCNVVVPELLLYFVSPPYVAVRVSEPMLFGVN